MIIQKDYWPKLPLDQWQNTYETLHLWSQIVGKIRLSQMPWINHSWHVPFYVTARGLTTSLIPYGHRAFEIDFDFADHRMHIATSGGERRSFCLKPMSVAEFYRKIMRALDELDIEGSSIIQPGGGRAILASLAADASRLHRFPRSLHWEGKSGTFLLGRIRSICDSLFGTDCTKTPRWCP